jgi:hypothetical protein
MGLHIALFGKFIPVRSEVSIEIWEFCEAANSSGHEMCIFTNAERATIPSSDSNRAFLKYVHAGVHIASNLEMCAKSCFSGRDIAISEFIGVDEDVFSKSEFNLVIGWSLDPYAIVAAMVARVLNLPLYVRITAEDINRLIDCEGFQPVHQSVLSQAHAVFTSDTNADLHNKLESFGIEPYRIIKLRQNELPSTHFRRHLALGADVVGAHDEMIGYGTNSVESKLKSRIKSFFDPLLPTIGVFTEFSLGGASKLAEAVKIVRDDCGSSANLIFAPCEVGLNLERFVDFIARSQADGNHIAAFPPLPPWENTELLGKCDIACVLENGAPAGAILSRLPREILAAGVLLVISRDVAETQGFSKNLVNMKNCCVVENPHNAHELAAIFKIIILDAIIRNDIARHGSFLSKTIERFLEPGNSMLHAVTDLYYEQLATTERTN